MPFYMYRRVETFVCGRLPAFLPARWRWVPRLWAENTASIVFWQEHEEGGRFAA